MYSTYDRNFIRDYFVFQFDRINPALCIGRRKNPNSVEVNFALRFFIGLSSEELETINFLVKDDEDEVLVEFFQEIPGDCSKTLSSNDMKDFDFSRKWTAHRMSTGWDEMREVSQNILAITFK